MKKTFNIKRTKYDEWINNEKQKACISLEEPAFGVAAGQLAVFYDGQKVIGSAWIESTK